MRRAAWPALALAAGALALACGRPLAAAPAGPPPTATPAAAAWGSVREIVIPAGTQARLDAGEPVEVLETEIHVKVDETVRIRNDDDVDHVLGPYYLQSGAALEQTYRRPQTVRYTCFVNPTEAINLVVDPD